MGFTSPAMRKVMSGLFGGAASTTSDTDLVENVIRSAQLSTLAPFGAWLPSSRTWADVTASGVFPAIAVPALRPIVWPSEASGVLMFAVGVGTHPHPAVGFAGTAEAADRDRWDRPLGFEDAVARPTANPVPTSTRVPTIVARTIRQGRSMSDRPGLGGAGVDSLDVGSVVSDSHHAR